MVKKCGLKITFDDLMHCIVQILRFKAKFCSFVSIEGQGLLHVAINNSEPRWRPISRLDSHPHWPRERHPAEPPQLADVHTHEIALCENKTSTMRPTNLGGANNWLLLNFKLVHARFAFALGARVHSRVNWPSAHILPYPTPHLLHPGWRRRLINRGADGAC